jgi:hypothetical protein
VLGTVIVPLGKFERLTLELEDFGDKDDMNLFNTISSLISRENLLERIDIRLEVKTSCINRVLLALKSLASPLHELFASTFPYNSVPLLVVYLD